MSLNFLVPAVAQKIDFSRAIRGLRGMPRRLLLIGHKLSAGTLAVGSIQQVTSEAQLLGLVGEGSMLAAMWRAARANADVALPIDLVAVAEGSGGVAASSTVVVTSATTNLAQAGEVMLYIGGVRVTVGVTTVDTAATVATKLIAAVNAQPALPVTATAGDDPGEMVLTCRWVGLTGNDIDVRATYFADDVLPTGVTLTLPPMAGGTTSPDVSVVVTAMTGYRATEIVCPFTDSTAMATLEAEMTARWGWAHMADGQLCTVMRGTQSAVGTWLNSRNSEQVHTVAVVADATNPWETAAMVGAAVETAASLDPAQPVTGIALVGYRGPKRGAHFNTPELNALLLAGGSPLAIAADGTGTLLRLVTNYTQNVVGAPDGTRREVAWVKTMSYYRWYVVTEFQLNYVGWKIAEYIKEPIPGQKVMTAELGQEIMLGLYGELMKVALVQNMEHYSDSLSVEVDGPNGRLKITDEPVIVTQHYQTEITSYMIAGHVG